MPKQITPREVLALRLARNDIKAATVRDYLVALLGAVWAEGEGFSGKRPFGNSGWQDALYWPLVNGGYINGGFDEDGYLDTVDTKAGDAVIAAAISYLAASEEDTATTEGAPS